MNKKHEFDNVILMLTDEDEIPAPNPLRKASSRQNYLVHAARMKSKYSGAHTSATQSSVLASFRLAFKVMLVVLLAAGGLLAGTVYAAADSLPGDFLYPLSLQVEKKQLDWEREPEQAAHLALSFADKRLSEIDRLVAANRQKDIPIALQEYQRIINNSRLSQSPQQAEVSDFISNSLTTQEHKLLAIRTQLSEQNGEASAKFQSALDALHNAQEFHLHSPEQKEPNPSGQDKPGIPPVPGPGNPHPPGQGNPGPGNPNPPGQGSPSPPGQNKDKNKD